MIISSKNLVQGLIVFETITLLSSSQVSTNYAEEINNTGLELITVDSEGYTENNLARNISAGATSTMTSYMDEEGHEVFEVHETIGTVNLESVISRISAGSVLTAYDTNNNTPVDKLSGGTSLVQYISRRSDENVSITDNAIAYDDSVIVTDNAEGESLETSEITESIEEVELVNDIPETPTIDETLNWDEELEYINSYPENVPNWRDDCKSWFYCYMGYHKVTSYASNQYRMLNDDYAWTDPNTGFRMWGDRICIALGSGYTHDIGRAVDVVLEDGTVLKCILGDAKDDVDTDEATHTVASNGNVVEFIVDYSCFPNRFPDYISGNVSKIVILDRIWQP